MAERVLLYFPDHMTIHEKLDRLARLDANAARAIDVLVTDALRSRWPYQQWEPRRGRPFKHG